MTKTDLYNQLKQEQYKMDIEAIRWRMWAVKTYCEQSREEFNAIAERDENESMGVYKAQMALLPKYRGKLNEESSRLLTKYLDMKHELEALQKQKLKEVA
jgi:hypothetical protein